LAIRSRQQTIVFNGGTDLLVQHRSGSGTLPKFPFDVLYIGDLPQLQRIEVSDTRITIGSAVKLAQILHHPQIPEYVKLPILQMGSPAIRNLGTIGGNICNASPAGDTLPMLYALEAVVTLASQNRTRALDINEFITGPGKTKLEPDEIVTQITIPVAGYNRYCFKKVGARKANAITKVSFFAAAIKTGLQVQEVRMAFGAVGPTIIRSAAGEAQLKEADETALSGLAQALAAHYETLLTPIDDRRSTAKYRQQAALRLLQDFIVKELTKVKKTVLT